MSRQIFLPAGSPQGFIIVDVPRDPDSNLQTDYRVSIHMPWAHGWVSRGVSSGPKGMSRLMLSEIQ